MKLPKYVHALLALTALLGTDAAYADACAGFSDVDANSSFCKDVEWIKNRGITLGCASGLYCPNDSVSRLQMAIFLTRLGTALSPQPYFAVGQFAETSTATQAIPCKVNLPYTGQYPQSASVDIVFSALAAADTTVSVSLLKSDDFGTTWSDAGGGPTTHSLGAGKYSGVDLTGVVDLLPEQSETFGVGVVSNAGATTLAQGQCWVKVMSYSRTGDSSPY